MSMLIKCDRCGHTNDAAIRMKERRFEIKTNRPIAENRAIEREIELPQEIHLCARCEELFAYWIEKGRWEKVDNDE